MEKTMQRWEKINSTTADIGDLLHIKWIDGRRFMTDRYICGRVIKHSKNRIFIRVTGPHDSHWIDEVPYTKIEKCLRKVELDADLGI